MKPLHNNVLTEKLPVEQPKSNGGILLPTKPEQHYKVISCGPKANNVKPGAVIKPFPYVQGIPINHEGKEFVMFNTDQFDDIISNV